MDLEDLMVDQYDPIGGELHFSTEKLKNQYEIGSTLGKGAFSVVVAGTHKVTRNKVAIKCIKKAALANDSKVVIREVEILKKLYHPNIIRLYDVREDRRHFYLVMELGGKELFEMVIDKGSFSEAEARPVIKQTVEALAYLHRNNIVHRDLKPENLLCEGSGDKLFVKVADFGLSKETNRQYLQSRVGSPGYVAPEIVLGKPYDKAVDFWSVGVIMYVLLAGFAPFNDPGQLKKIVDAKYSFNYAEWKTISKAATSLISNLLVKDPHQRYGSARILADPWLTGDAQVSTRKIKLLKLREYNSVRKMQLPKMKLYNSDAEMQKHIQEIRKASNPTPAEDTAGQSTPAESKEGAESESEGGTVKSAEVPKISVEKGEAGAGGGGVGGGGGGGGGAGGRGGGGGARLSKEQRASQLASCGGDKHNTVIRKQRSLSDGHLPAPKWVDAKPTSPMLPNKHRRNAVRSVIGRPSTRHSCFAQPTRPPPPLTEDNNNNDANNGGKNAVA